MTSPNFGAHVLDIDLAAETDRIVVALKQQLRTLKRRGFVLGLSGGIDSTVCAALAVRAVGKERVFGLHMPEGESADDTLSLSQSVSTHFGMESVVEDISGILDATGCYRRRDDAIRTVIPEFTDAWKSKIVLPSVVDSDKYRMFSIVAQNPNGEVIKERLPMEAYLAIVAATNFKQRTRIMLEYHQADRLNYAVLGTPNRLEYDQGFFVKNGDGAADVKPIAHLYKSQVYALAEFLEVPSDIRARPPTTDTYSLPQSQDEFYFSLPYAPMDLCLYALNHGVSAEEVAPAVQLSPAQVEKVFKDIAAKRRATRYGHLGPLLVEPVAEVAG